MVCFFDLDGTLTDPGLGITNSIMYAMRKLGLPVGERENYYKYIGPPLVESFVKYEGASLEDAQILLRYYREYFSETGLYENRVYDGIPELLDTLRSGGCVNCLATSKPDLFSEKILRRYGLLEYFEHLACNTMDEKRSSKADVVAYGLELSGIKQGDPTAVMVGDREHDIIGAHANGLQAIGVTYGYGSAEELQRAGADWIVNSVAELRDCLLDFNK